MRTASLAGLGAGLLLVSLISAPPEAAEADEPVGPTSASPSTSITERPTQAAGVDAPVDVTAPDARAKAVDFGSIAVGTFATITWQDCPYNEDLDSFFRVLAITGADDGSAYTTGMAGPGAVEVWVLDARGEVVTYAGHPDAMDASPRLEWEYRTGDFLLVLSGPQAQAGATATLTLSGYTGDGTIPGAATARELVTDVAGELDPRDRYLPFHGGHYESVMRLPRGAQSGQLVVLEFEGEDTDWLSVAVLTGRGEPVLEYAIEDGWVAFPLRDDEVFVVTSLLPDEFGAYAYTWVVLPDAPVATDSGRGPQWWDLSRPPFYTVTWPRDSALITPETLATGLAPVSHRVEVSRDGRTWVPADLTGRAAPAGTAEVELWEGDWHVRIVVEAEGYEVEGDPITITSWGDQRGWEPTAVTLNLAAAAPVPGKPDGYRDLRGAITGTETYRDGRTRPIEGMTKYSVQFRYAGRSDWIGLVFDRVGVSVPASGDLRVVAQTPGTAGVAVSDVVPVTVHGTTGKFKGSIATPTRSSTVPGAMDFHGSIVGQWADGSWRPAVDGTWYKVQHYSKGKWRTLGSAQTNSANPGAISRTFLLNGTGKYRIVVGKSVIKTWTLKPVAPTRTAMVLKPIISPAGTNRHGVSVAVTQRYADGRWGAGQHGWTYTVQYRAAGAKKWRRTTTMTMTKPGPFDVHVRTPDGPHEFRVAAKYKGRTYTSPVGRA